MKLHFLLDAAVYFHVLKHFFLFSVPKWGDVSFQHRRVLNRTLIYDCSFSFRFRDFKKNLLKLTKKEVLNCVVRFC